MERNTIELSINGERLRLPEHMTVAALLEQRGLTGKRLAVERNGEIVSKGLHASAVLQHGDCIEIVVAVGGG